MIPAPNFEHTRITSQPMELLGPPARAAGLTPTMGGCNLGESESDTGFPIRPVTTWVIVRPTLLTTLSSRNPGAAAITAMTL